MSQAVFPSSATSFLRLLVRSAVALLRASLSERPLRLQGRSKGKPGRKGKRSSLVSPCVNQLVEVVGTDGHEIVRTNSIYHGMTDMSRVFCCFVFDGDEAGVFFEAFALAETADLDAMILFIYTEAIYEYCVYCVLGGCEA